MTDTTNEPTDAELEDQIDGEEADAEDEDEAEDIAGEDDEAPDAESE